MPKFYGLDEDQEGMCNSKSIWYAYTIEWKK